MSKNEPTRGAVWRPRGPTMRIVLILLLAVGCRSGGRASVQQLQVIRAIAGGHELDSIRIGMTYADLHRLRPLARPALYVGAFEVLRGDTIRYYLDRAPRRKAFDDQAGETPTDGARLIAVERWIVSESSRLSEVAWTNTVSHDLVPAVASVDCFQFVIANNDTLSAAAGKLDEAWAGTVHRPAVTLRSAGRPFPLKANHNLFIAVDLNTIIPTALPRIPMQCPRG